MVGSRLVWDLSQCIHEKVDLAKMKRILHDAGVVYDECNEWVSSMGDEVIQFRKTGEWSLLMVGATSSRQEWRSNFKFKKGKMKTWSGEVVRVHGDFLNATNTILNDDRFYKEPVIYAGGTSRGSGITELMCAKHKHIRGFGTATPRVMKDECNVSNFDNIVNDRDFISKLVAPWWVHNGNVTVLNFGRFRGIKYRHTGFGDYL